MKFPKDLVSNNKTNTSIDQVYKTLKTEKQYKKIFETQKIFKK